MPNGGAVHGDTRENLRGRRGFRSAVDVRADDEEGGEDGRFLTP